MEKDDALTLAIISAVIKHGPNAIFAIYRAFQKENVTADEIKELFINKDPEDYFK